MQNKIKEEEEKNKPPEQDEFDAKGRKIPKKESKKESKDNKEQKDAGKDTKKDAKKDAKKDSKKDTKKKGGEIKLSELMKEEVDKTIEY